MQQVLTKILVGLTCSGFLEELMFLSVVTTFFSLSFKIYALLTGIFLGLQQILCNFAGI